MDPVFCATKMSKMIRITSPTTSAHHAAASRVNGERVVGVSRHLQVRMQAGVERLAGNSCYLSTRVAFLTAPLGYGRRGAGRVLLSRQRPPHKGLSCSSGFGVGTRSLSMGRPVALRARRLALTAPVRLCT